MKTEQLHVVGISGGKDSTALGLRLAEMAPHPLLFLITPTGDELPDMIAHWDRLREMVEVLGHKWQAIYHPGGNLEQISIKERMLPSTRARWCTRLMKIVPYAGYLKTLRARAANRGVKLEVHSYVGLRADEPERGGMYGEGLAYHYPLRDWGWGVEDVWAYLDHKGITIPPRTDCASCPFQRLYEWYRTHSQYPEQYEKAVQHEAKISDITGKPCTIRNPGRDRWPADLRALREEFRAMDRLNAGADLVGSGAAQVRSLADEIGEDVKRIRRWRALLKASIKGESRENSGACRVCTL